MTLNVNYALCYTNHATKVATQWNSGTTWDLEIEPGSESSNSKYANH